MVVVRRAVAPMHGDVELAGAFDEIEGGAMQSDRRYTRDMVRRPLPPRQPDPVIEALKKDVDRTLLRENLALTPEERLLKLQAALDGLAVLRQAFGHRSS